MKEKQKKLVYEGIDVLIYEDGWWMTQATRRGVDRANTMEGFKNYTLDKNDRTKEITIAYLP
jgi:hypothetical protein